MLQREYRGGRNISMNAEITPLPDFHRIFPDTQRENRLARLRWVAGQMPEVVVPSGPIECTSKGHLDECKPKHDSREKLTIDVTIACLLKEVFGDGPQPNTIQSL